MINQNSEKHCTYSFVIKDTNQYQPNDTEKGGLGGSWKQSFSRLSPQNESPSWLSNQEAHLSLVPEFLLGLYYLSMIDWIIDPVCELNLQPLSSPRRSRPPVNNKDTLLYDTPWVWSWEWKQIDEERIIPGRVPINSKVLNPGGIRNI